MVLVKNRFSFGFSFALGVLLCAFMLLWAGNAQAAKFVMLPETVDVIEGQTVDVVVQVYPEEDTIYTVKLDLSFDSTYLRVEDFSWQGPWLAINHSSYDVVDNDGGQLLKTAGYPKGFSEPVHFGVIRFLGKRSGATRIDMTSSSLLLTDDNANLFDPRVQQGVVARVNQLGIVAEPAGELATEESDVISEEETTLEEVVDEAFSDTLLDDPIDTLIPNIQPTSPAGELASNDSLVVPDQRLTQREPQFIQLQGEKTEIEGELNDAELAVLRDRINRQLASQFALGPDGGNAFGENEGSALFDVIVEPVSAETGTPIWPFLLVAIISFVTVMTFVYLSQDRKKKIKKKSGTKKKMKK